MKLKFLFLLIAQVAFAINCFSQSSGTANIKELQIGDYVPRDMVMGKIINHKSKSVKFSDFKGKLLIIDFWSTTCSDCVGSLPEMDSLQKVFGDKIAIIPATYEDSTMISKYLKKKPWNLPSIVDDTRFYIKDQKTGKNKVTGKALWGVFPHYGNPYEVWIDENGKILAITKHQEVNATNIQNYLTTGKLTVKTRKGDLGKVFDEDKDLLVDGNGGMDNQYVMRSILTEELDLGGEHLNTNRKYHFDQNGKAKLKSIIGLNLPSWSYYLDVFRAGNPGAKVYTNFFLEGDDGKEIFLGEAEDDRGLLRQLKNFTGNKNYCYNLTVPPPGVIDTVFYREYMLNDLNRYFDYSARVEKRKIPCLVFFNPNKTSRFLALKSDTSGVKYEFKNKVDQDYLEYIGNFPMKDFLRSLSVGYFMAPPIINETGYADERINLKLHLKHGHNFDSDAVFHKVSIEEWRKEFLKNGLDVKLEDREVEVMIFKKKMKSFLNR